MAIAERILRIGAFELDLGDFGKVRHASHLAVGCRRDIVLG
jgi:hypothetical protein